MLQRLVTIAMSQYQHPFNEIQFIQIPAIIDKSLITTSHRGIEVPIEGGWDSKNSNFIILTFSKPVNMIHEAKVLKGLIREFTLVDAFPMNIKKIAYWDLSKGQAIEIDYQSLQAVDKHSLIAAVNKIL